MLCERCKKKKAVMFYNENINGKLRSFNLCADCASAMQQSGELEDLSSPFSHFSSPFVQTATEASAFDDFFGLPMPEAFTPSSTSTLCPLCGQNWSDILKQRSIGCDVCYTTFSNELAPLLSSMSSTLPHKGKVPRSHRQKQEMALKILSLKQQLREAIQSEQFESAASLRDQIRTMETQL